MPFPDELFSRHVEVVPYRNSWACEGAQLVAGLSDCLPDALSVEHIGSTSVPGLPAKDCLDVMVQVRTLADCDVTRVLESEGYRRRPEHWNREEISYGVAHQKLAFAPAVGARPCNIHVRERGGLNVRYALLFRDYLSADTPAAEAWGRFKLRLAESVDDIFDYGQIKAAAQEVLMQSAETWADGQCWQLPDYR